MISVQYNIGKKTGNPADIATQHGFKWDSIVIPSKQCTVHVHKKSLEIQSLINIFFFTILVMSNPQG